MQLKEQAVESVAKEIETYFFINQLKPNKYTVKSEIVQQSLHNLIDLVEEKNQELITQAKENGIE